MYQHTPPFEIVPAMGIYDKFMQFRAVILCAVAECWSNPEFEQAMLDNTPKALFDAFGYIYPFSYRLTAQQGASEYTPRETLGWVINKQEKIRLPLPPKPVAAPGVSQPELEARALANYYLHHISLVQTRSLSNTPPTFPSILPHPSR
ncbi:BMA_0021/BMA_0022 family TOMM bacteriocin [Massilia sp. W12]|uniref:BMA_0021/BMA_0022 family TOMM bacteriocin n=1 Tax=Massilia sp. W12 TaxID=3126507 RepID=UPI0030D4D92F